MLKFSRLTGLLGFLLSINTVSVIAQPAYPTFEQEGIIFELQNCNNTSRTDTPLKCEFRVENTREGRRTFIIFADKSRIVDAEGNEIFGLTANLGNKGDGSKASSEIINGISIKGSITFKKAPVGTIQLVDLSCGATRENSSSISSFNVEIPFAKQ